MLFVNEVAGVRGAPAFLLHKPHDADGMTATDVVFPAFLFIVGMAIPFALGGRRPGDRWRPGAWPHVLGRALALLVMGVLMVNAERASNDGGLFPALWNVLMTLGVVLVWSAPATGRRTSGQSLKVVLGATLLVVLAFAYRGPNLTGIFQIRPYWWGILGLIGWAYLVAGSAYLLIGERPAALTGLLALLYCLYLADEAGGASGLRVLRPWLDVGSVLGSHAAVVLAGTLLAVGLKRNRAEGAAPWRFAWVAAGYASALAAAGLLLHSLHGLDRAFSINKPLATPPWCLLSSAVSAAAWMVVFLLADALGFRRWPRSLWIAGENALLVYFMAPFLLSLFALTAPLLGGVNAYEALGRDTLVGLFRSAFFAWIVVRLCGWLRSQGVRLQL
jgi:hypothetical protein